MRETYDGGVAPVVETAEAPGHVVVIGSLRVKFFNPVKGVNAQFHVLAGLVATIVLVCRYVNSEGFQIGETVSGNYLIHALALDELDTAIEGSRAHYAPLPFG